MGYQAYGPPYGMYQPQPPPPAHIMDPSLAFNGLNVTDPRFAAKYGNPYLRAPVPPDMPPPGPTQHMGSPQMNPRNYSFASLSRGGGYQQAAPSSPNMQGFSTGQRPKKANVNYTGTMVGNGKVANNGQKANVQQGQTGNQLTGSSQYIVSPETDAKSDAMATHV